MCSGGGGVYCRDACLVQFKVRNSKCGIRGPAVEVVAVVVVVQISSAPLSTHYDFLQRTAE